MTIAMCKLQEGRLEFRFPDKWRATAYDKWPFYNNRFKDCCGGSKAVDILALGDNVLWLIEVKDYREHPRTKEMLVWDEMAIKVRDTLAGLVSASLAEGDPHKSIAAQDLRAKRLRAILHFEQPSKHSKLFPRAFDPEKIRQKLRSLLKPIDAHPRVVELNNMAHVPWTATSIPGEDL
jgi:hypothetical protein